MAIKRKFRSRRAARQAWALDTLHQVWLAGLGAASKAQQGAPQLLEELVAEGARVESRTRGIAQKAARGLLSDVQSRITERIGDARGRANDALENLEKIFQTRVHRALTQLGIPSAEALAALSKRVDKLNISIEKLSPGRGPARRRLRAARRRVRVAKRRLRVIRKAEHPVTTTQ